MLLDAAYAGNAGVKLLAQAELNQLPDQFLARGDALNSHCQPVSRPAARQPPARGGGGQVIKEILNV
jgi:hypothetical protein